jgi:hypothetical protein
VIACDAAFIELRYSVAEAFANVADEVAQVAFVLCEIESGLDQSLALAEVGSRVASTPKVSARIATLNLKDGAPVSKPAFRAGWEQKPVKTRVPKHRFMEIFHDS